MTNITGEIISQLEINAQKKLEFLRSEFMKVRTGRAHPGLIENVKVDYYGIETPLSQLANIMVNDPRSLTVVPWEKSMLKNIEKAISNAELGFNPMNDGNLIRVPVPPLNEERRKEMVKIVKEIVESTRIAVRNLRRDANNKLKDLLKKKEISEDDERKAQDQIQKITDKSIADADSMLSAKEKDLMEI